MATAKRPKAFDNFDEDELMDILDAIKMTHVVESSMAGLTALSQIAEDAAKFHRGELGKIDLWAKFQDAIDTRWDKIVGQLMDGSQRQGMIDAYSDEGIEQVMWVAVGDANTCDDCADLHGEVMSIDEFWAYKYKTRCGGNCRCEPGPVDADKEWIEPMADLNERIKEAGGALPDQRQRIFGPLFIRTKVSK